MYKIGLTGGIASGKSTVVQILKGLGISVINLDEISCEILYKKTPGYREVISVFGQAILDKENNIDRKKLGEIVFKNDEKRKKLEEITHPLIIKEMERRIDQLSKKGEKVVVVEVPLLIETEMMDYFDEVWLVYTDEKTQLERLKKRNALDDTEALLRIKSQLPLEEKKKYADKIILNTGDLNELKDQIIDIWRDFLCSDLP